jgi:hypothetical protein
MSKIEVDAIDKQSGSTLTLGGSGTAVTLASGATQSGFGRTGTVDWDTTAKTASFTAVSGNGYFVNTTSGAITVTLPAGSAGSIVSLKDYANTWNTNNVTVTPNGTDKINGTNANAVLNTQDQSVTLVYVDSTKGWRAVQDSTSDVSGASFIVATGGTITTCGNFKIHSFTGPGTFCVSCGGNAGGSNSVDYLVVAGGGGGGRWYGGGGGAGGYRFSDGTVSGCYSAGPAPLGASALPVSAQPYTITVGAGGVGSTIGPAARATSGGVSTFSTITSAGGGGAGGNVSSCYPTFYPGGPGGSGGGAKANANLTGTAGSGNTPPTSPPQGFPAGNSNASPENNAGGGGAGGASNPAPTDSPGNNGGFGGVGLTSSITGSPVGRGGGGAGNGDAAPYGNANPTGGPFGGGVSNSPTTAGSSGSVNTGGGGGAGPLCGSETNAGSGGSGIVIIRYKFQ